VDEDEEECPLSPAGTPFNPRLDEGVAVDEVEVDEEGVVRTGKMFLAGGDAAGDEDTELEEEDDPEAAGVTTVPQVAGGVDPV
jgi:hypothetical protein